MRESAHCMWDPHGEILRYYGINSTLEGVVARYNICVEAGASSSSPTRRGARSRISTRGIACSTGTVERILRQDIHGPKPLVDWCGFKITPCHPEELAAPVQQEIDYLYNLELGDDVGDRLKARKPQLDAAYGTGSMARGLWHGVLDKPTYLAASKQL